jgi:hypothetical protein
MISSELVCKWHPSLLLDFYAQSPLIQHPVIHVAASWGTHARQGATRLLPSSIPILVKPSFYYSGQLLCSRACDQPVLLEFFTRACYPRRVDTEAGQTEKGSNPGANGPSPAFRFVYFWSLLHYVRKSWSGVRRERWKCVRMYEFL